jgi:Flp pilus assembly pilin Flp
MTNLMNRFRRIVRSSLVNDERGLSTVEYVIILVLIAAAAVGVWTTLGGTIRVKIDDSNKKLEGISVDNDTGKSDG